MIYNGEKREKNERSNKKNYTFLLSVFDRTCREKKISLSIKQNKITIFKNTNNMPVVKLMDYKARSPFCLIRWVFCLGKSNLLDAQPRAQHNSRPHRFVPLGSNPKGASPVEVFCTILQVYSGYHPQPMWDANIPTSKLATTSTLIQYQTRSPTLI